MFFPIDRVRYNDRVPFVNYGIIAANFVVFFLIGFREDYEAIASRWGFTPAAFRIETIFTSMFMHMGTALGFLLHLCPNMFFLWLFGNNVERRFGHPLYLLWYLLTGVCAVLAHAVFHMDSTVPLVGASGAVSGVMGMYMILFPRIKIEILYGIPFLWSGVFQIPAIIPLSIYFGEQILYQLSAGAASAVAYLAHIGGFVSGAAVAFVARKVFIREGFILDERVEYTSVSEELTDTSLSKPITARLRSSRLLYDLDRTDPVAALAKKFVPLNGVDASVLVEDLPPDAAASVAAQAAASRGLVFRNLELATARPLIDRLQKLTGNAYFMVPNRALIELPPAAMATDLQFTDSACRLATIDGLSLNIIYRNVLLIAAGQVRPPDGAPFAVVQVFGLNPWRRYLMSGRTAPHADFARIARDVIRFARVGYVNKGIKYLADGTDMGTLVFCSLTELDTYLLWFINVINTVRKIPMISPG